MTTAGDRERDLAKLDVQRAGRVEQSGSPWEPYRLVGFDGIVIRPASEFLKELQAAGRTEATQRSYGM